MTESAIEAAANAMLALERENARPSHLDYARVALDAAAPLLVAEIEEWERLAGKSTVVIGRLEAEIERLRVMYSDCIKDLREASE
jgi:hypothetical protein